MYQLLLSKHHLGLWDREEQMVRETMLLPTYFTWFHKLYAWNQWYHVPSGLLDMWSQTQCLLPQRIKCTYRGCCHSGGIWRLAGGEWGHFTTCTYEFTVCLTWQVLLLQYYTPQLAHSMCSTNYILHFTLLWLTHKVCKYMAQWTYPIYPKCINEKNIPKSYPYRTAPKVAATLTSIIIMSLLVGLLTSQEWD
jgi:hypothetical protein